MLQIPPHRRLDAAGGLLLIVAAGLGVGVFTWFTSSLLVPIAYSDRPLEYLFLGAPPLRSIVASVVVALALSALHAWAVPRGAGSHWSARSLAYVSPLVLLGIAPLGAAIVLAGADPRLAPLTYVVVDLRWWWSLALVATSIGRFDRRRGDVWREAIAAAVRRSTPAARLFALDAALLLLLPAVAILSSPILRFTAALHGDEPKYLRLCENLYQGLGLDVAHQRPMDELTLTYAPPLWRNAALFAQAVREDAGYLAADARTLATRGLSAPFNRAQFVEGWFVRGRNGGFYQVHNPGFSLVLFPAYFVDRHVISTSAGYQGVFPTSLPVTNLLCLLIWSLWGVVLFRLLRAALARDTLAWALAAAAMLTMPVSAFAFQIYPETSAGLIVTAACTWLLYRKPDASRVRTALLAGAAVGFLPWLHVRFLVTSLVLAGWGVATLRRRRAPFAAAYVIMCAGICLYAYHITGSLRPDAMYESEGSGAPWRLNDALQSMMAYPFDRIWGFLPHAPVFLFALPGWAILARADRRTAALLALLIASLVLAASGHGFTGTGATPLRFLVAVIPLAMVPVGHALLAWGRSRWVRAAFVVLLVVSVDASLSYNTYHHKEVGRMVVESSSGWTPNLLFPWTHAEPWAHWRGTFVLFLLWASAALALLVAPALRVGAGRSRQTRSDAAVPPPRPLDIGIMTLAAAGFVAVAMAATALGGEWSRADYFPPVDTARLAAIRYGSALARCSACYSSFRGTIGRGSLVEDTAQTFAFVPVADDVESGEDARINATAMAKDGPDYGALAVDFGDASIARTDLLGRSEVRHAFAAPGKYRVAARFAPHGGAVQYRTVEVAVRPGSVAMDVVDGLPEAVKRAAVRGTIASLQSGPAGLTATLDDGSVRGEVWLLTWDGTRWQAHAAGEASAVPPGWAVAIAADEAGRWRTSAVTLRWPSPWLLRGAPTVVYP